MTTRDEAIRAAFEADNCNFKFTDEEYAALGPGGTEYLGPIIDAVWPIIAAAVERGESQAESS